MYLSEQQRDRLNTQMSDLREIIQQASTKLNELTSFVADPVFASHLHNSKLPPVPAPSLALKRKPSISIDIEDNLTQAQRYRLRRFLSQLIYDYAWYGSSAALYQITRLDPPTLMFAMSMGYVTVEFADAQAYGLSDAHYLRIRLTDFGMSRVVGLRLYTNLPANITITTEHALTETQYQEIHKANIEKLEVGIITSKKFDMRLLISKIKADYHYVGKSTLRRDSDAVTAHGFHTTLEAALICARSFHILDHAEDNDVPYPNENTEVWLLDVPDEYANVELPYTPVTDAAFEEYYRRYKQDSVLNT